MFFYFGPIAFLVFVGPALVLASSCKVSYDVSNDHGLDVTGL